MAEIKQGTAALKEEKVANDHEEKQDLDLKSILNVKQRTDLTLLLAKTTESMRRNIIDNFDATATLNMSLIHESESEEDKIMNPNLDPGTADVEAYDRERKLMAEREKEISTSQMKQLKASALKAYDEWREEAIQRVGEVVNNRETAQKQKEDAGTSEPELPIAPKATLQKVGVLGEDAAKSTSLHELFPPIKTPLLKLDVEKRILILHSLLLLFLSLEHYSAPSRVLMLHIASSLHLSVETLSEDEAKVARGLMEAAKEMSGDDEIQKKAESNKESRKWKVGLASAAGAAIIGVTGGMAAPLVAAGVGSVMGGLGLGATAAAGYLGTVAGSTVVVGALFGAYGAKMTGQMMDNYAREVEDFKFLPVHGPDKSVDDAKSVASEDRRLRVTVGISGWLTEKDEVVKPWRVLGTGSEVFALRWELEALMTLGNSMNELFTSAAYGYAQKELIKRTVFADLMAAMWPIGLVKVAGLVDNPFSVAKSRAEKAGEVLADAIIHKAQGERPLTLIGYSLGARVIYSCLLSLAKRKAFGLVESVVLMGSPLPSDTREWRIMRTVVSGRLVNVYSENDYVLGFLYRTSSIQYGIAGLQKVEGLNGVENVDVSDTISGHLRYRYLVGNILKKIGFEDIDVDEVQREEKELKKMEEEEKKKSMLRQTIYKKQEGEGDDALGNKEANDLVKEAKARTDQSMMEWAYEQLLLMGISRGVPVSLDVALDKDMQKAHMSYVQRAYQYLPGFGGTGAKETAEVAGKATEATSVVGGKAAEVGGKAAEVGDAAGIVEKTEVEGKLDVKPEPEIAAKTDVSARPDVQEKSAKPGAVAEPESAVKPVVEGTPEAEGSPDVETKPEAVEGVAGKGVDTTMIGSRGYLQRAYASLPHMPHLPNIRGSGSPEQSLKKAGDTEQGYLSKASSYIPNIRGSGSPEQSPKNGEESQQGYLSKASSYLPHIRRRGSPEQPPKKVEPEQPSMDAGVEQPPKKTEAGENQQGYLTKAASYVPSIPGFGSKNPSVPNEKSEDSSPNKAGEEKGVAEGPEKKEAEKESAEKESVSKKGAKEEASAADGTEQETEKKEAEKETPKE
jgi:hypothetical protein